MKRLSKFISDTKGNVGMMFGLLSIPLLLAAGVAIDFGRVHSTRAILQAAVDAAAFAGGTARQNFTRADLQRIVEAFLRRNNAEYALDIIDSMEFEENLIDGLFTVRIRGRVKTSLMNLAGIDEIGVGASSVVSMSFQSLEVAMVLDNTGSMNENNKIGTLKIASKGLVDILESEKQKFTDIKIGLVPFVQYVNVGKDNKNQPWVSDDNLSSSEWSNWKGCVSSRAKPLDVEQGGSSAQPYPAVNQFRQWAQRKDGSWYTVMREICPQPILPLTGDYNLVRDRLDDMDANGWTFIPAGVLWGWNVLSSDEPFTQGRTRDQLIASRGKKVMLVMTDGFNTVKPDHSAGIHETATVDEGNRLTAELCTNAKNDHIEIYSIAFMVTDKVTRDMLEKCATAKDKYFNADDANKLLQAFRDIAQDLASTRLTQ
jgi:Flp pilus assembly protein TadG